MGSFLIAIIYLAFISLGLPDALLGAGWPSMQSELGVPLSYAGTLSMLIASGTIVSSLASDRLTRKFGAGVVTCLSVGMTAFALFGFSISNSFWLLCVFAVPYGLGAGAVDAALNNYVALHYASRHMNWLHCFWGVGGSISPFIMGYALSSWGDWHFGYRFISYIQIGLTIILFVSLPFWKQRIEQKEKLRGDNKEKPKSITKIPGVKPILLAFFAYCAVETTTGLWASSYLVLMHNTAADIAARYASLFYIGITVGRFLCGFVSNKVGDKWMIRIGDIILLFGIVAVILPVELPFIYLNGLIVMGIGCAPIYPAIIHSTPNNFGASNSQAIIGVQMASAYTGSTLMPPLFGLLANNMGIWLYPLFLLLLTLVMLWMLELTNRKVIA